MAALAGLADIIDRRFERVGAFGRLGQLGRRVGESLDRRLEIGLLGPGFGLGLGVAGAGAFDAGARWDSVSALMRSSCASFV